MALFKINKGKSDKLPTTYNEGYCYFTTDDGKFYVDTTNTAAGRVALNALYSDANRVQELSSGTDLNGIIEPGYYGVFASATAQSLLNNPLSASATGIMLRVYKIGTSYYQEVTGTLEGGTYIRRYSSSWSAWRQLALITDNVASATKLANKRTVKVNLASTSAANFDGTANITPGVSGILPIANGGTGNTTNTAAKVTNSFVLKISSGTTEGTNLYTFNGSAAKTLDIVAGSNVTLTAAAGKLTIAATDTTYSNMTAATASAAGTAGLVPAPAAGKQASFLRGDGTWVVPTNTTYSAGTGISLSGTTFSNSGVRSIATGTSNGTISVNTNGTAANVAVKGLGSNAYTSTGLAIAQTAQPGAQYTLWIDTDEEAEAAMRADAIKYKTFSIATSAWSGSGPYTYTMTAAGITANSAIINLTLNATSQTYQKAQLDWETTTNQIILSTATKPTGTIAGYLIATDVTVI